MAGVWGNPQKDTFRVGGWVKSVDIFSSGVPYGLMNNRVCTGAKLLRLPLAGLRVSLRYNLFPLPGQSLS